MNLAQRISKTIQDREIFRQDDLILVALSGGADSVALLLILCDLGYRVEALHCNFHLRGEESDRDQQFVSQLCESRSIPLHITHFDTRQYAHEHKVSLETAARQLRYEWFDKQAQTLHAQAVAVAHHRDDQAETLLLHIIRGSGLRGLAGMKYRNGLIRRPLLDVGKEDILAYLAQQGQDYVTDSTNLEREAMRNKVRLDILPALAELNPNIVETLSKLAWNVQDALPIYEQGLPAGPSGKSPFTTLPFIAGQASLTLLHECTTGCGFTRTQLQNILQAGTGRMIESSTHRLLRDRNSFILHDKSIDQPRVEYRMQVIPASQLGGMKKGTAYLDKDKVSMPLIQRGYAPSDRFTPFGMKGSRLVSDYLTDLKLNRFEKENQQLVTDAGGNILWIAGHASDDHYRITPSTREVLILSL